MNLRDPKQWPRQPRIISYENFKAAAGFEFVIVVIIPTRSASTYVHPSGVRIEKGDPGYPLFMLCHADNSIEVMRQAQSIIDEWAAGQERAAVVAAERSVRAQRGKLKTAIKEMEKEQ